MNVRHALRPLAYGAALGLLLGAQGAHPVHATTAGVIVGVAYTIG